MLAEQHDPLGEVFDHGLSFVGVEISIVEGLVQDGLYLTGVPLAQAGRSAIISSQRRQRWARQTAPSASLGQYSPAASLTAPTRPLLASIGSVLFPRLAANRDAPEDARRLQWEAVAVTLCVGSLVMGALAALALPSSRSSSTRATGPSSTWFGSWRRLACSSASTRSPAIFSAAGRSDR